MTPILLAALLSACDSGKIDLGSLEEPEDIEQACDDYEPQTVSLEVLFQAQTEPCAWGEGDNLEPANGLFTARVEQTEALEMPADSVICDMTFDFSGLVPDEVQVMVYDDHFFFTFNDIVLAASYGPVVSLLDESDGLRAYDWDRLAGFDYHREDEFSSYCLGQETGDAACDIPDTEVEGAISLSYSEALVSQLSFDAIESDRYDFAFVTTGDDNIDTDCMHEAFGFTVEVPYLTP